MSDAQETDLYIYKKGGKQRNWKKKLTENIAYDQGHLVTADREGGGGGGTPTRLIATTNVILEGSDIDIKGGHIMNGYMV